MCYNRKIYRAEVHLDLVELVVEAVLHPEAAAL